MWSFTILRAMIVLPLVEFLCMSSRCFLIENTFSGTLFLWLILSTNIAKLNNWGYFNWPESFLIVPIFFQYQKIRSFESILPVTNRTCFSLLFVLFSISLLVSHKSSTFSCDSRQKTWDRTLTKHRIVRRKVKQPPILGNPPISENSRTFPTKFHGRISKWRKVS